MVLTQEIPIPAFKRMAPDKCQSTASANITTLTQDVIEEAAKIFEASYIIDAVGKIDTSDPANQVIRKSHVWDLQKQTVRELRGMLARLVALRVQSEAITGRHF